MSRHPLCLALLLLAGCSAGSNGSPDPTLPATEFPDPSAVVLPEDAAEEEAYDPIRDLAADLVGSVILNGVVTTSPSYKDAPFAVTQQPALANQIALYNMKTTAIPSGNNSPLARFLGPTVSYGSIGIPTSSGVGGGPVWQYMPIYLTENGSAKLEMLNNSAVGAPLYNEAVAWDYQVKVFNKDDNREPDDDENPATVTDRVLAQQQQFNLRTEYSMYQRTAVSNQDQEDWHKVKVTGGNALRINVTNSNGTYGTWTMQVQLYDPSGTLRAEAPVQQTSGSLTYAIPVGQTGTWFIRILGTPVSRRGGSVYYVRYSLKLTDIVAPDVISVSPVSGATGDSKQFSALLAGGAPTSYAWNFGGGATPNTSTAASPTVLLNGFEQYDASLTVSNAAGSEIFPFTLTVNPPAPDLTAVTPANPVEQLPYTFAATNVGGPVSSWVWDFGGAGTPNVSTLATPTITMSAPGVYNGSVRAANITSSDVLPFTITVGAGEAPLLTGVMPGPYYALRTADFTAINTGGAATSWAWDFGGGATPNISTVAVPSIQYALPGVYNGSVTATNMFGNSTIPFTLTVVKKKVPLDIIRYKSGTTEPRLWWNLPNWSDAAVITWINTYTNSAYNNAGIVFEPINITTQDRPDLYNLDNGTEQSQVWAMVLNGDPKHITMAVVNNNNYGGWAGVMTDGTCNPDNEDRGCIVTSYASNFQPYLVGHELGHTLNLPHIRTNTSPITAQNNNMMSYGVYVTTLSTWISREGGSSCYIWNGNPMNQFQVVNNWIHQYIPEAP